MYNETPWRMSGNENETNPYTMSRNVALISEVISL